METQSIYLPIPPDFWDRYESLANLSSKDELNDRQRRGERRRLVFKLKHGSISPCRLMTTTMNPWHTGYPYYTLIERLFPKDGGTIEGSKAILNAMLSFDNLKDEAAVLKAQGWPVSVDPSNAPSSRGNYKNWFILGKSDDPSKEVCQYLSASESWNAQRVMNSLMSARRDINDWYSYYRVIWSDGRTTPWSLWEHLPQYEHHRDERKAAKFDL